MFLTFFTFFGIIYASFVERWLHKNVMHKPFWKFTYPCDSHRDVHHKKFRADDSYHLANHPQDKRTIPMAWWNGPALVAFWSMPFYISSFLATWTLDLLNLEQYMWLAYRMWHVWTIIAIILAVYYGIYETIHWCMHLPDKRRIENTWWFRRLNGHHLLHHRYMNKNFNVVWPLADLLCGTLLLRSPIKFKQATGPSVPNVQPLEETPQPANQST